MYRKYAHKLASRLIGAWRRSDDMVLLLAIALGVVGALHTARGFKHLIFGGPHFDFSGGDLRYRHAEISAWFSGQPVYGVIPTAVYPPASYPVLYPFVGWVDLTSLLWLWAFVYAASLFWLVRQVVQATPQATGLRLAWVTLIPLSMFATGRAIEVGQLVPFFLPPLLAGLMMVCGPRATWRKDIIGASLITIGLIKPTAVIPIVLLAYVVPGRFRPAALITSMYAGLTLFAASFQPAGVVQLMRDWLAQDGQVNLGRTNVNLHRFLGHIGHTEWLLPLAALILLTTAWWVWTNRKADLWLLMGVTGLVARMWMYHRPPDDLLILPAVVALFRVASSVKLPETVRVQSAMLLAVTWLWSLTSRLMLLRHTEWQLWYDRFQAVIWVGVLVFLVAEVRRRRVGGAAHASKELDSDLVAA